MEQKAWIRKQSGMTTAGQTESCCMERGLEKSEIEIREKNGVTYLAFPALDATGLVSHAFSTRHGGVSEGVFSTMNFSFTRNDDPQHVWKITAAWQPFSEPMQRRWCFPTRPTPPMSAR